jgi:hypothetical protein
MPEGIANDLSSLQEIVSLCGSFLTIRKGTVYFMHQSAKEFLLEWASNTCKRGHFQREAVHFNIFLRSFQVMSTLLRRDIYKLIWPGCPAKQIETPMPDPLASVRYMLQCKVFVSRGLCIPVILLLLLK